MSSTSIKVAYIGLNTLFSRMTSLLIKQSPIIKTLTLCGDRHVVELYNEFQEIKPSDCRLCSYSNRDKICEAIEGADIVVIGDGAIEPKKDIETFENRATRILDYGRSVAHIVPNAFVVIAASPVNIFLPLICELYAELGCLDIRKLAGITTLDILRANSFLASELKLDPKNTVLPVVGGCSPKTRVPLFSHAYPNSSLPFDIMKEIVRRIKYYDDKNSITPELLCIEKAYATVRFIHSIANGLSGKKLIPEIALIKNTLIPDTEYFSLPIMIGKYGIENVFQLKNITKFEDKMLKEAVDNINIDKNKAKALLKLNTDDENYLNDEKLGAENDFVFIPQFINNNNVDDKRIMKRGIPSIQLDIPSTGIPHHCPAEPYLETPSRSLENEILIKKRSIRRQLPLKNRSNSLKKKKIGDFKDYNDLDALEKYSESHIPKEQFKIIPKKLISIKVSSKNQCNINGKAEFDLNPEADLEMIKKNIKKSIEDYREEIKNYRLQKKKKFKGNEDMMVPGEADNDFKIKEECINLKEDAVKRLKDDNYNVIVVDPSLVVVHGTKDAYENLPDFMVMPESKMNIAKGNNDTKNLINSNYNKSEVQSSNICSSKERNKVNCKQKRNKTLRSTLTSRKRKNIKRIKQISSNAKQSILKEDNSNQTVSNKSDDLHQSNVPQSKCLSFVNSKSKNENKSKKDVDKILEPSSQTNAEANNLCTNETGDKKSQSSPSVCKEEKKNDERLSLLSITCPNTVEKNDNKYMSSSTSGSKKINEEHISSKPADAAETNLSREKNKENSSSSPSVHISKSVETNIEKPIISSRIFNYKKSDQITDESESQLPHISPVNSDVKLMKGIKSVLKPSFFSTTPVSTIKEKKDVQISPGLLNAETTNINIANQKKKKSMPSIEISKASEQFKQRKIDIPIQSLTVNKINFKKTNLKKQESKPSMKGSKANEQLKETKSDAHIRTPSLHMSRKAILKKHKSTPSMKDSKTNKQLKERKKDEHIPTPSLHMSRKANLKKHESTPSMKDSKANEQLEETKSDLHIPMHTFFVSSINFRKANLKIKESEGNSKKSDEHIPIRSFLDSSINFRKDTLKKQESVQSSKTNEQLKERKCDEDKRTHSLPVGDIKVKTQEQTVGSKVNEQLKERKSDEQASLFKYISQSNNIIKYESNKPAHMSSHTATSALTEKVSPSEETAAKNMAESYAENQRALRSSNNNFNAEWNYAKHEPELADRASKIIDKTNVIYERKSQQQQNASKDKTTCSENKKKEEITDSSNDNKVQASNKNNMALLPDNMSKVANSTAVPLVYTKRVLAEKSENSEQSVVQSKSNIRVNTNEENSQQIVSTSDNNNTKKKHDSHQVRQSNLSYADRINFNKPQNLKKNANKKKTKSTKVVPLEMKSQTSLNRLKQSRKFENNNNKNEQFEKNVTKSLESKPKSNEKSIKITERAIKSIKSCQDTNTILKFATDVFNSVSKRNENVKTSSSIENIIPMNSLKVMANEISDLLKPKSDELPKIVVETAKNCENILNNDVKIKPNEIKTKDKANIKSAEVSVKENKVNIGKNKIKSDKPAGNNKLAVEIKSNQSDNIVLSNSQVHWPAPNKKSRTHKKLGLSLYKSSKPTHEILSENATEKHKNNADTPHFMSPPKLTKLNLLLKGKEDSKSKYDAEKEHLKQIMLKESNPTTMIRNDKPPVIMKYNKEATSIQMKQDNSSVQMKQDNSSPNIKPNKSSANLKQDNSSVQMKQDNSSPNIKPNKSSANLKQDNSSVQMKQDNSSPNIKPNKSSANLKHDNSSVQMKQDNSSPNIKPNKSSANLKHDNSSVQMKQDNSSPNIKPNKSSANLKHDNSSVQTKQDNSSPNIKPNKSSANLKHDNSSVQTKQDNSSPNIKPNKSSANLKHDNSSVQMKQDNFSQSIKHNKSSGNLKHDNSSVQMKQDNSSLNIKLDKSSANLKHDESSINTEHDKSSVKIKNDESSAKMKHEESSANTKHDKCSVKIKHEESSVKMKQDESSANTKHDKSSAKTKHDKSAVKIKHEESSVKLKQDDSSANTKHDKSSVKMKHDESSAMKKHDKSSVKVKKEESSEKMQQDKSSIKMKLDESSAKMKREESSANMKHDKSSVTMKHDESSLRNKHNKSSAKTKHGESLVKKKDNKSSAKMKHNETSVKKKHKTHSVNIKQNNTELMKKSNKGSVKIENGKATVLSKCDKPTASMSLNKPSKIKMKHDKISATIKSEKASASNYPKLLIKKKSGPVTRIMKHTDYHELNEQDSPLLMMKSHKPSLKTPPLMVQDTLKRQYATQRKMKHDKLPVMAKKVKTPKINKEVPDFYSARIHENQLVKHVDDKKSKPEIKLKQLGRQSEDSSYSQEVNIIEEFRKKSKQEKLNNLKKISELLLGGVRSNREDVEMVKKAEKSVADVAGNLYEVKDKAKCMPLVRPTTSGVGVPLTPTVSQSSMSNYLTRQNTKMHKNSQKLNVYDSLKDETLKVANGLNPELTSVNTDSTDKLNNRNISVDKKKDEEKLLVKYKLSKKSKKSKKQEPNGYKTLKDDGQTFSKHLNRRPSSNIGGTWGKLYKLFKNVIHPEDEHLNKDSSMKSRSQEKEGNEYGVNEPELKIKKLGDNRNKLQKLHKLTDRKSTGQIYDTDAMSLARLNMANQKFEKLKSRSSETRKQKEVITYFGSKEAYNINDERKEHRNSTFGKPLRVLSRFKPSFDLRLNKQTEFPFVK